MTYEEALELFNNKEYEDAICNSKLCNCTSCYDCKYMHMKLTIIDALEKQMPKKPIDNVEQEWFECPTCGRIVVTYYDGKRHHCR